MKTLIKIPFSITTLALIWTLAGCDGNTEPETTAPTAVMSDNSAMRDDDMKMSADASAKNMSPLGVEHKLGPLSVKLTTMPRRAQKGRHEISSSGDARW